MFYSVGIFRTSGLEAGSQVTLRQLLQGGKGRGGAGYTGVLQQRSGSLNIKTVLLIKETSYVNLKNLVFFCVWKDIRVGNKINPLINTSAVSGQHPVFPQPECPQDSPQGLATVTCLLDGRYSFSS